MRSSAGRHEGPIAPTLTRETSASMTSRDTAVHGTSATDANALKTCSFTSDGINATRAGDACVHKSERRYGVSVTADQYEAQR